MLLFSGEAWTIELANSYAFDQLCSVAGTGKMKTMHYVSTLYLIFSKIAKRKRNRMKLLEIAIFIYKYKKKWN